MEWIKVEDRPPEKEHLDYYKDDYSKSVIGSNSNTGQVYEKAVRYSFKYKGWVDYDFPRDSGRAILNCLVLPIGNHSQNHQKNENYK